MRVCFGPTTPILCSKHPSSYSPSTISHIYIIHVSFQSVPHCSHLVFTESLQDNASLTDLMQCIGASVNGTVIIDNKYHQAPSDYFANL